MEDFQKNIRDLILKKPVEFLQKLENEFGKPIRQVFVNLGVAKKLARGEWNKENAIAFVRALWDLGYKIPMTIFWTGLYPTPFPKVYSYLTWALLLKSLKSPQGKLAKFHKKFILPSTFSFKEWLLYCEAKAPYVYHVTLANKLDGILEHGLRLDAPTHNWGGLSAHAKLGVFFSDNMLNVNHWINIVQNLVESEYESAVENENNFVEKMAIPIISRFRFNREISAATRWRYDSQSKLPGDYFTLRNIPPEGLEFWNGKQWIDTLYPEDVDVVLFVEKEDIDGEKYWTFKTKYPMPF